MAILAMRVRMRRLKATLVGHGLEARATAFPWQSLVSIPVIVPQKRL